MTTPVMVVVPVSGGVAHSGAADAVCTNSPAPMTTDDARSPTTRALRRRADQRDASRWDDLLSRIVEAVRPPYRN